MLSLRFLASDHYDAGFPEGVLDSYYVKGNETQKQLWFNSRSNHNSLFKSPQELRLDFSGSILSTHLTCGYYLFIRLLVYLFKEFPV